MPPIQPCPDAAVATLTEREAALAGIRERQPCIGGHAAGEEHRSAQGMRWPSDATERAVAIEIGYAADLASGPPVGPMRRALVTDLGIAPAKVARP